MCQKDGKLELLFLILDFSWLSEESVTYSSSTRTKNHFPCEDMVRHLDGLLLRTALVCGCFGSLLFSSRKPLVHQSPKLVQGKQRLSLSSGYENLISCQSVSSKSIHCGYRIMIVKESPKIIHVYCQTNFSNPYRDQHICFFKHPSMEVFSDEHADRRGSSAATAAALVGMMQSLPGKMCLGCGNSFISCLFVFFSW